MENRETETGEKRTWRDLIAAHRLPAAVAALQCAFLLLFFVKCFGAAHTYSFDGGEDGITSTGPFYLSAGAYEVVVHYGNTAGDGRASGTGPLSDNYAKILGSCKLQSQNHPNAFHTCEIVLEDVHEEASAYVWVKTGAKPDDAEFVVQISEGCDLKVTSITVEEKRIWRVTRLAGWLLLFVLADLLWLLLFEEAPFHLKKEQKYAAGILTLICIAVNLPLMTDYLYDGHDLLYHLERINSLATELARGQFPVRIETGMLNGYGYVSPVMYGSLFLYFPAALQCVMVPLETAYKLFVMAVNCATCLLTYRVVKRMSGKRWLALTGTFVYTFSAYRLVDVYVRAAVGEYTAMLCFPLLVSGFYHILAGEAPRRYTIKDIAPIILGLTGVIQSHIISCEMVGLFIAFICLLCVRRVFQKERFFALLKAAAGTVLLNLWFLVPFLSYFGEDLVLNGRGPQNIQNRGAYLSQIFDVFLCAGGYNVDGGMQDEMGLGIGVALTAGLLLSAWYRIRYGKLRTEKEKQAMLYLLSGLAALFLSTVLFPWDSLQNVSRVLAKGLSVVQFPWRYLAIATILLLFLLLVMLELIAEREGEVCAKRIAIAIVAITCIPTGLFFRDFTVQTPEQNCYGTNEIGTFHIGVGEYLLKGEDLRLLAEERLWTDGVAKLTDVTRRDGKVYLTCENPYDMDGKVTIPVICYPNYVAADTLTGQEIAVTPGDNCQICLTIPAGYRGEICVWYRVPVSWRVSEVISLLALAGMLVCRFRSGAKSGRRNGTGPA